MDYKELAAALGRPLGPLRVQMHRALKRLKAMKDSALADLTRHNQRGIAASSSASNAAWLADAAQIQLDLVDLLERKIKNGEAGACR